MPAGWYTTTSPAAAALAAAEAAAAAAAGFTPDTRAYGPNSTRDGLAEAEPGFFAVAGIRFPCAPGRFGARSGLASRLCSGFCPPGFACPLNATSPQPCVDGSYATGGADHCIPCPAPRAPVPPAYPVVTQLPLPPGSPLPPGTGLIANAHGGFVPLSAAPAAGSAAAPTPIPGDLGGDAGVDEAYREAFVLNANEVDWASPRLPGGGDDDSRSGGPAARNRNTVPTSAPLARCNTARWCCGMV